MLSDLRAYLGNCREELKFGMPTDVRVHGNATLYLSARAHTGGPALGELRAVK